MKIRIPTNEEHDRMALLTRGQNEVMHWRNMLSWTNADFNEDTRRLVPTHCQILRGLLSSGYMSYGGTSLRSSFTGFRPAVCLDFLCSNIPEGKLAIIGTLYMDGKPVKVPDAQNIALTTTMYQPHAKLEMREALDDPAYLVFGIRVGDVFIADRPLVCHISYEDIEQAIAESKKNEAQPTPDNNEIPAAVGVETPLGTIVVKTALDSEHPGVYIDLRRKGCECDMPLVLVEYCGDEADKPDGEKNIITRVWGNAGQEDYTERVVHEGIEDYFAPEEPDEYVVLGAPGVAVQMLAELKAAKMSHWWVIAQGRRYPAKKVHISLYEGCVNLPPLYPQCYIIRLRDDVRPGNSKVCRTEDHTEESLVKLLTELLDGLK